MGTKETMDATVFIFPALFAKKKKNHTDHDCWYKNRATEGKNLPQCYHCKKIGHVEKICFQKAKEQANFLEEKGKGIDEIEDKLFVTCPDTNIQPNDDMWYLDSGCSNHMTGHINFFVDIDELVKPNFRLGNNNQVQVHGLGTIVIDSKYGKKCIFDVMYVPGLAQNLLSLGQLMKKSYYAIFYNEECMIYEKKSRKLVLSVKMTENKMFPLSFSKLTINVFSASSDDSVLWHKAVWPLKFWWVTFVA